MIRRLSAILRCCSATVLLLVCGCSKPPTPSVQASAKSTESTVTPTVAVVGPKLESLRREAALTGEFRPYQVADLHAKVAGYLRQITVDVGSHVKAGQQIATLEVPEMASDIAQSAAERSRVEAEIQRARAEVDRAQANLKLQVVSHGRLTAAAKVEPGLIAQQEIDEALARQNAAEAQLASSKAALGVEEQRLESAKAAEQRARTMAAYTGIIAPFSGVVTKRFADVGAMIQAGTASQTQAMPLVRLADLSRLRLAAMVPESLVPMIAPGQKVEVRVTSLHKHFPGTVSRLNRDVASASRTMEAEIDVNNPGLALTPGMYAEVVMTLEKREQGLTVPVGAVINSGGNRAVWIVTPAGIVEQRAIQTGIETTASLEVISGLTAEDRIIISNRSLLKPGQKVHASAAGAN